MQFKPDNISIRSLKSILVLSALFFSSVSIAGLITGTGGYAMTDFVEPTGELASSAVSENGDVVGFFDQGGASLSLSVGDGSWWSGSDSEFYFTNVNWVELYLPQNTLAFSLNLDATSGSMAWAAAVSNDGSIIDSLGVSHSSLTDISNYPIKLSGETENVAFHMGNSGGSCGTIEKIVVDPWFWGMGDFSIHVDDNACSTNVPEPSVLLLLVPGIVGIGVFRRRRRTA